MLQRELDLETPAEDEPKRDRSQLMGAMGAIDGRYGKGAEAAAEAPQLRAAPGYRKGWPSAGVGMKLERHSPQYTTRLEDVPVARA